MGLYKAKWWHKPEDKQGPVFKCDLCPRGCELKQGQRGFCFGRIAGEDGIMLPEYGKSSGFAVDPIEKKPLYQFYPGSSIFSFGTVGCNLGCKFCQNSNISKAKEDSRLLEYTNPESIAATSKKLDCTSVAFTYNEPIVFAEYAIEVARACHESGIRTVAVTAGYINDKAREEFFAPMDAANVDLKSFDEKFYRDLCQAHLKPVLDTLIYLKKETNVWLELTTLLIPGHNDSEKELDEMTAWIAENLGRDVPLHFSAFHPAYKLTDVFATPFSILKRAREIAHANGLQYVYTGNVDDSAGQSTYCPQCKTLLIERSWRSITMRSIKAGTCEKCGYKIAGHFL